MSFQLLQKSLHLESNLVSYRSLSIEIEIQLFMLYWKASVYIRSTYEINQHQPTSFESNMLGIPFLFKFYMLNHLEI